MVLCPGSPCRLRQAGFHSPVRSSPVLCTQPISTLFNTGGKPQDREVQWGGGGRRRWGLTEAVQTQPPGRVPRSPGSSWLRLPGAPCTRPSPPLPARQPPSPPPALPSDTDRCEPLPSPPPGQSGGTCHRTRSQHPACLDPRLSLIPACFKSRPSAKPKEN